MVGKYANYSQEESIMMNVEQGITKLTINGWLPLLVVSSLLTGCNDGNDKVRQPINLSRTISADGLSDFSANIPGNPDFQDVSMPPNQEVILLAKENNPDADNVAFTDTTATLWKFYLER